MLTVKETDHGAVGGGHAYGELPMGMSKSGNVCPTYCGIPSGGNRRPDIPPSRDPGVVGRRAGNHIESILESVAQHPPGVIECNAKQLARVRARCGDRLHHVDLKRRTFEGQMPERVVWGRQRLWDRLSSLSLDRLDWQSQLAGRSHTLVAMAHALKPAPFTAAIAYYAPHHSSLTRPTLPGKDRLAVFEGPQYEWTVAGVEMLIELAHPAQTACRLGRVNVADAHAEQPPRFDKKRVARVHRPAGKIIFVGDGRHHQ